ncbi:MAG: glycosyltransferase family 2 protein [Bacteroidales bacterium]|nr:glycosyltransferase family 2 protein [Bacteroidales bacterium]
MAEILTIVVTYNGMKWIERCLKSALGSTVPADVMVVDNGSDDGTPAWIRESFPEVMLTESRDNLGFGAANNIGIRYALEKSYKYIYLLNQDAWVLPETFGTLIRAFEEDGRSDGAGRLGILSPMQMEANLTRMDAQLRKHCGAALEKAPAETVRVPFVMAAHWMVNRSCLETVGAFSPAFPHYGEDVDYLNRAAYHGFDAAVVKTASAVHDRADRPRPKDYRMKLKVITAKAAVADPRHNPSVSLLVQSIVLALQSMLHLSAIPWKGIGELRRAFGELKSCRKQAQQRGAFL